jgi:hypothetical protein
MLERSLRLRSPELFGGNVDLTKAVHFLAHVTHRGSRRARGHWPPALEQGAMKRYAQLEFRTFRNARSSCGAISIRTPHRPAV